MSTVPEKTVDVHQAWTREDALVTDAGKAIEEVAQKLDFKVVSRSKVSMSSLGGDGCPAIPVTIEKGLPQAGSGGDEGPISGRMSWAPFL